MNISKELIENQIRNVTAQNKDAVERLEQAKALVFQTSGALSALQSMLEYVNVQEAEVKPEVAERVVYTKEQT